MKLFLRIFVIALVASYSANAQVVNIDGIPRDTSFTLGQTYRKELKKRSYIVPVIAKLPVGILAKESITYKSVMCNNVKHDLKMNIYRPDDNVLHPALIMIHGGGWNSGNLSLQVPMAQHLAVNGYVTIPVEYRLIPEALYPAGVDDLEDAIRWVYKHAKEYSIDKNRIAVSGCSAGGQLAMLLGMKNKSGKIKAVINMDGISTFITDDVIERAQKARDENASMPVDAKWLGGTYRERRKIWEEASAMTWISKRSAPVCFINSSISRFHNGRGEAEAKLNELGIYTEVHTHSDTPHTFWFFHPWFDKTVEYMTNFLDLIFNK